MTKIHTYTINLEWTGNRGEGTSSYISYARSHNISGTDKEIISCSADPVFRGDAKKYNPEELLLASLAGCHMLWFLHLCANAGISVLEYIDTPGGTMEIAADGSGRFTEVVLHPIVTVGNAVEEQRIDELHDSAHKMCFIANSVNFPVTHKGSLLIQA
ncbi:MAG: OsmC family protein [Ignavibacteria bacterium]|nr:OsmC family protein [Ignavibacteria bacterium]